MAARPENHRSLFGSDAAVDYEFPWDVPTRPQLSLDYRLDDDENAIDPRGATNAYLALIRDSREVCSHCFSRIRSVSTYRSEARSSWRRSKREHLKHREESRPIASGGHGFDDYRTFYRRIDGELRPSTGSMQRRVSCETCGWQGTRTQSGDLSFASIVDANPVDGLSRLDRLVAAISGAARRYRHDRAPYGYRLDVDRDRLPTEIGSLKLDTIESPGDTEIFVIALAECSTLRRRIGP